MDERKACVSCGNQRAVLARGMCDNCYSRNWRQGQVPTATTNLFSELGISYRQLDYWARHGYLRLADGAPGSGTSRQWPESEIAVAAVMARLVRVGFPLALAHRVARAGTSRVELEAGVVIELVDDLPGGESG